MNVVLADVQLARSYMPITSECLRQWALLDEELASRVGISVVRSWLLPDGEPVEGLVERIRAHRPALVGFSCFVWNFKTVREASRRLKELDPGLLIAWGGPQVSALPELLARHPEADYISTATEGEETFHRLLRRHSLRDGALETVPGLAYRDGARVRLTAPAAPPDAARLPSAHLSGGLSAEGAVNAIMETSRGCPYGCKYCDWGAINSPMRYMPLERVEAEFRHLADKVSGITLADADILMNRRHGLRVLEAFFRATRGSPVRLEFQTNPTFLSPEVADLVSEGGPGRCTIYCGAQTVNREALELIDRKLNARRVEENFRHIRRRAPRLNVIVQIMFALPGECYQDFRRSLNWAFSLGPRAVTPFHTLVMPGSDLWREAGPAGMVFQAEPPHQVRETDRMSPRDIGTGRNLIYHILMLNERFRGLKDELWRMGDAFSHREMSWVEVLEGWIGHLREEGLDLTYGLPVSEVGETTLDELYQRGSSRLKNDPALSVRVEAASARYMGKLKAGMAERPAAP